MTAGSSQNSSFRGASLLSRLIQIVLTLAFGFIVYSQGVGAYSGTQEALKLKAVADNAAVKQHAESILLSGQARTALEVARNAARRTKGEADTAEAEADKIEAEARTFKEKAIYAQQKARADAMTVENEFGKRKAETIAKLAQIRNLLPTEKAQTEQLESQVALKKQAIGKLVDIMTRGIQLPSYLKLP